MQLLRHRPNTPLNDYVDCFWWSQRDLAEPVGSGEHMLPSGGVHIIFALHESPIVYSTSPGLGHATAWRRSILHGPQRGYYRAGPKPAGATVGIAFRPGAAGAMLRLPITELTDRHVAVDDVWGASANRLRERLLELRDPRAIFAALEQELTTRLARPLLLHPAVALTLGSQTPGRVADIQRQAGYSPRHFIHLFSEAVGLTPKHYHRIKRFSVVIRRLAAGKSESLAALADLAGYSDQAHLAREFREFSGVTPTQYRPRDATASHHHRIQVKNLQDTGASNPENRARRMP